MREIRSGDKTNRSTTISIVWRSFFSSSGNSSREYIIPSTRTREKPFLKNCSEIWINSPFFKQYSVNETTGNIPKIPKDEISKIFYYMKNELSKIKTLSAYETVIAINEFFDFNYDYVVKKVLSPKIRAEILEDYYNNGMKERIDNNTAVKLF